jgi:hypothetical protein
MIRRGAQQHLVPDRLPVDCQGGDEEDRERSEEGGHEGEWTVSLKLWSPCLGKPHETECRK